MSAALPRSAHQDNREGRSNRRLIGLDPDEQIDPDVVARVLQLKSRARRRDAPGAAHLELEAGHVAELLDMVLPSELQDELRRLELVEACVIVVVALAWVLGVPVRVLGGMFDRNGTNRDVGGNGWSKLAGAARGRETYSASNLRKRFNDRPELWIPVGRMKECPRGFENRRTHRDGRPYASTGATYTRCHARKHIYFPASVYRVVTGLALTKKLVLALYAVRKSHPAFRTLQAMRKAAGPRRRANAHRDINFWSSIAWSKSERELQNKRLPRIRIRALAESISKKDPPKGDDQKEGAARSAASRSGDVAVRSARRPRSQDAGRGKGKARKPSSKPPQIDSDAAIATGPPPDAVPLSGLFRATPPARAAAASPPERERSRAVLELAAELGAGQGDLDLVEDLEAEKRWRGRATAKKGTP